MEKQLNLIFNFQMVFHTNHCQHHHIKQFKIKIQNKDTKQIAIYSYLEEELTIFKTLTVEENFGIFKNNEGEIWIICNTHYIGFKNLNNKIIEELKNKNLGFLFFNLNNNFIKGFKFE